MAAVLVEEDLGFVPGEAPNSEGFVGAVRRVRVFAGHAGWGPGQLEGELAEEAWIVEPPRREEIFTGTPTACGPRSCAARAASSPCSRRCRLTRR